MKVWFGCTTAEWLKYRKYYFAIRDMLKSKGCIVLADWIDDTDRFLDTSVRKNRNIKKHYGNVIKAIQECDFTVIEHTVPSFSSSHQINYSLMRMKPTLVLRLNHDNKFFSDSYIDAINSPHMNLKDYNLKSLENILDEFIGITKIGNKPVRSNLVLTEREDHYLNWASQRLGKSRSEITRDAIQQLIKKDKDYKNLTI